MITLEGCSYCNKAKSELFTYFNHTDTSQSLQHFDHNNVRFIIYHIHRNDIPRIHQQFGKHTFPMIFIHDRELYHLGGSEIVTDLIQRL